MTQFIWNFTDAIELTSIRQYCTIVRISQSLIECPVVWTEHTVRRILPSISLIYFLFSIFVVLSSSVYCSMPTCHPDCHRSGDNEPPELLHSRIAANLILSEKWRWQRARTSSRFCARTNFVFCQSTLTLGTADHMITMERIDGRGVVLLDVGTESRLHWEQRKRNINT